MDNGAIVHIDYDLYEVDSERLIETTREDVAKENDIFDENREYSPMITVVGDGRLIAGFEESLSDAEAEKDYEIDIEAPDAYGERDASLVETIGQNVLMRSVRDPNMLAIGAPVEIGGRTGVLQFLSAGRARIDYNHPLAGSTLRYNYNIVKVVEDRKEKVETLLKMNTGRDDFQIDF
ncbi:MAG TPA: peptidylprolyl isomerase, partial [Candidatus Poseidoniales archaeon]